MYVLSCSRNFWENSVGSDRRANGRPFHTKGPTTEKALHDGGASKWDMKEALLSRAKVTGAPSAKGRATKVSKVGRGLRECELFSECSFLLDTHKLTNAHKHSSTLHVNSCIHNAFNTLPCSLLNFYNSLGGFNQTIHETYRFIYGSEFTRTLANSRLDTLAQITEKG